MRKIFLFFAAILCAMSTWASYNVPAGYYVYFEKPSGWSQASLLLGHNSYSIGYSMTKIDNTSLYYWKTDKWDGYTEYFFMQDKWGSEGSSPTHRNQYAGSNKTSVFKNEFQKYHLFTTAGSKSSHATDRKAAINRTQTIKVQLKDGSNWVDATVVPADLTASTYAMTDNSTAVSAASASLTKESTIVSATVSAAYSATVTLACTNVLDGYVFEGWYDANGNKITSYTVSDAHTVQARFIQSAEETNEVSVSYVCDATTVSSAIAEFVGVETEKSFTAPTVTGYQFTNWTIGGGMTLTEGTATDATITVVTKSASSDYTLVANYKEVQETVYFINASKWSKVHLHLWNGNAVGTEWPGTQLTATGEKIGEYDVYSYTAKQGDHLNLLFHENTGDVNKTTDLTWAEGVDKYYIHNYNSNTGWYTKAEAEELLVVPVVYETVYFVNNKNWSLVQIHAWNGSSNNGWPGQALTATGEKVEGFDVYSFEAAQGTYTNLIFNNKKGDAGEQSENYVWTADKYYYMGADSAYAGGTKEEVAVLVAPDPFATDVYLVGAMNGWSTTANEFRKATEDATTASVTVALSATTTDTCEFKLFIGGEWKGNNGTMQRGGVAVHESGWSFEEDGNCKIVADIAGDYTFTWDLTTKKLTVTYPELPKYTVTATAENGTIEGIENEGVYTQGDEVTLTATAAEGYHFVKWDDESTDNPRIITVTEDVTLQAIFEINNYTITASTTREKLTQTIAIDGDNADWANIPMLSEPGVGPMVKMVVPQEGTTLPEGAAYALMIAGDEEHVKAGYPKIFTDADKDNTTPSAAWFSPNMGFDYELATWSTDSKYAANTAGTIREMCIMQAAYDKDGFGFDGSVWGVLYFSTPSDYFIPAATTSSWKSTYRPFIVEPTQYVYNPLAGTHAAADVYATHAALPKGESFKMFNNSGDTAFWAAWTVELSQPAIYNVATNWTTDNGSSVDLYLIDAKTNTIVATFEGGWNSTATGVEEYGKWDLTNVPAGKYVLKMKNHVSWSNMVFNAVTLTPQDDVVIANTVTGSGNYNHGAEVTLTATPATGYEFVEWSDGETANPYTFTASEEVNLTATFQKKSYTVTIVKEATNQTIAIDGNNSDWAKIPMLSEPGVSPMVKMIVPQEGVSLPDGAAFALMVQGEEVYTNGNYPKTYVDADHNKETALWSSSHYSPNFGMDYEMATWSSDSKYAQNDELKVTEMCIMQVAYDKDGFGFDGNLSAVLKYKINENDYFIPNGYKSEWKSTYRPFIVEPTQYVYNPLAGTHAAKDAYATHVALPKGESFNMGLSGTSYDTAFWAGWTVNLTQPVIYNVSMNMVSSGSSNMHLHLVDVATNQTVAHFISDKVYPDGETACGTWDLTAVPAGKYILKLKNQKPWSDVVFTSVTLTPQESNVEIESAEHILTGDGTYLYGEVATLNATPAIGYSFVNWSDGATANPYSFIVTKDVEIAANFEKLTYTVTATATNGTVTGAGTYNHGEEVTLTATPAFDYQFVKWSNESTENPLTITVTDNVTLEAIFAEVAATEKKESGVFSISAHKTATFATGNLQYNVGTDTWRFAKQQYQVVGEQNINLGDPAFTGWIDMLGWSNGEANNYGVNPSNKNEDYAGEFVDWGTKMGEGWSTLSAEEWSYLLNTRENAASLKQTAKVDTILGILLFPDGWVMPEDVVVEAEMDEYFEVNIYNYTLEQWTKLEQAGAIFLPAAGRRTGGYGNMINYDQQVETREDYLVNGGFYRWQDNTNIYCYYWTSTINEDKNVSYLHNVLALGNDEYTIGNGAIWGEKGRYGQSVRLAKVAYDKHTVAATATNGTVTGAGTYEHGAEVTLTATPAFDYQFVKWSNESTENPLTITVADDVTLEAIFAEVAATEKKESGVFSISAHKTATFATGNLQYNVGTDTWRFAKQQYQVVGEQNINLGDPAFTDWIDMLGWSNGEANNYGVNPSNVNELYDGEFVDWGTKMGEGWSTLSAEEWSYLLNTRENAASLKQTAKVDTIIGLLLFPDGWVMPEDVVVEAETDEYFEVNIYNYTLEQWTKLEQAGAIFLPAAGRRAGGYGNMINYDQEEETDENNLNGGYYRHQDNTNIYCYYWTSTINAETKNVSYLHNVLALGNDEYTIGNGAIWGEKGRYGQSVRLAKVAYDKHTVTATAENGTITGAGEYTHGTEVTLTATPANEHYVFVNWTKGEEVVAETAEYTFTVEADVELVANFKLDSHTVAATAENGTVTGLVEGGKYEHGATATLTATAAEGYEFVNWTAGKDTVSTEATYTFTVEADVNLVANFQEVIPAITYTVKWYTAVDETTDVTLEEGAAITKPETNPEMEGYVFMGWTDECFVAEDGSDFTDIEDFGTADADKEYYAVFAVETTTDGGGIAIVTDLLNRATTGATNQNYVTWNGKTATSSAVYAGQSAGSNESIQLRSNNNNSGIVTTTSGGNAKKVTIDWNTNTSNGRTVIIYGKNSAYTQATDLYDTNKQGTELGTIVCGTSTELTISGEYEYIGIRSKSGAMYLISVSIDWETKTSGEPTTTYSNYMTTCTPDEYTIEWSVNGEVTDSTTVVEGDALVLPEAPAAPDACSDKVFMGWATTATVNADGTEITFVDETTVPEGDAIYYAVFATEIVDETNETYTKTATVSIAEYAAANNWVNATKYKNVIIDQNITATATSTGSNTGNYYANDKNWRLYQSDKDATLTIGAAEGVTINNVTVTYDSSNSGVLTFNSSNITSGDNVEVNASSVTFGVGNTGTATNGQVRVTNISVDYTFSGTITSTTYADYSTICVIPEYTVTFDYSVDAGYITVNDVRISEKEVTYEEGTELTVKALTFNNYRFDAWTDEEGNELTTEPEYTFTVTGDVVLKASIAYVSGALGTGVENNNVVSSKTMKVIQNGRLMIIREGKTYNAQGQMIE